MGTTVCGHIGTICFHVRFSKCSSMICGHNGMRAHRHALVGVPTGAGQLPTGQFAHLLSTNTDCNILTSFEMGTTVCGHIGTICFHVRFSKSITLPYIVPACTWIVPLFVRMYISVCVCSEAAICQAIHPFMQTSSYILLLSERARSHEKGEGKMVTFILVQMLLC